MVEKKDIQKRLCVAIKSSKLSQKVLAEKLGISSSTISKYIHKNVLPSFNTFVNLCDILSVSSDEILGLKK